MQNLSYTCSPSKKDQYLNQMKNHFILRRTGERGGFVFVTSVQEKCGRKINSYRQTKYERTSSYSEKIKLHAQTIGDVTFNTTLT